MALHTRVVVTGTSASGGCSRTEDCGARFRDEGDIKRVTDELTAEMRRWFVHVTVSTHEAA